MTRSFGFSRPHRPASGGSQGLVFQPTSPPDRYRPASHSLHIQALKIRAVREVQLVKGTGFHEGVSCRPTPEQCPFDLPLLNKVSRGFRAAASPSPGAHPPLPHRRSQLDPCPSPPCLRPSVRRPSAPRVRAAFPISYARPSRPFPSRSRPIASRQFRSRQ